MQIGMIGLGRMGAKWCAGFKGGHECVVFDRSQKAVKQLVEEKADGGDFAGGPREEAGQAAPSG